MRSSLVPLPLILCILAATAAVGTLHADEVVWHTSYKSAAEEARTLGRPILINLWSERCKTCLEMEESFWVRQDTVDLARQFVCLKVDVDRSRHLQRAYRAFDLPMVLLTGAGGSELLRAQGYPGPQALHQIMRVIGAHYGDLSRWTDLLDENDKNAEALVRLGHFFYEQGFFTVSNDFYRRALRSPGAREDKAMRAEVLVAIGWNQLRLAGQMSDRDLALPYYSDALKNFREYLRLDVEIERPDVALFGQIICHLARDEHGDAADVFRRLEATFPDSPATEQARQQIERAIGRSRG